MGSFFGRLEEFFSDVIYPNRWVVGPIVLLAVIGILWWARRRGWLTALRRHPVRLAVLAVPLVGVFAVLVSPLFIRTSLDEAAPVVTAPVTITVAPGAPPPSGSVPATTLPAATLPADRVGTFMGADEFHTGSGIARLIATGADTYTLRFEEFSVRNGPDLYVFLSSDPIEYVEGALDLGRLKATDGNFNYELPAGTDVNQFKSVVIWCKAFEVRFASATIA